MTATSKPAFAGQPFNALLIHPCLISWYALANQIRRTPSIGLLGQNAQQQPTGPITPGVQQFSTQLPSNPDTQATITVSGNSNLEFTPPPTSSSGLLQSPAGVQKATTVSRPLSDAAFDNHGTLSHQSSIHLTRWPSSSSLQQSSSLSSPNRADDFARRLSLDTTSYPQSTQVATSSQTPPLQSQSATTHSQISSRPDNFWNHVLESNPKPLQRTGSQQSDLSCATTEPASREPSPLLHEGRDPTLPVPVPRMPGLGHTLGRTEVEHAPSPPMSPRSQALSMGLKERDFAYEDFPGKAEHQKALAATKAARKGKTETGDCRWFRIDLLKFEFGPQLSSKGQQQIFMCLFHLQHSIPRGIAMKLSANPHSLPHRTRRNSLIPAPVPDTACQRHPVLAPPTALTILTSYTQVQPPVQLGLPATLL